MRIDKENIMDLIQGSVNIEKIIMKHRMIHKHIAIVMKRGKIIEVAGNMLGSRSKGCGYDTWSIHAERAVLKKIGDVTKLDGAILVVIRVSKVMGKLGNSKPCPTCQYHLEKCMKEYGLKSVYYSA